MPDPVNGVPSLFGFRAKRSEHACDGGGRNLVETVEGDEIDIAVRRFEHFSEPLSGLKREDVVEGPVALENRGLSDF